ncbi:ribonuclease H-like domain-containing protein [Tanacetum coccineum]
MAGEDKFNNDNPPPPPPITPTQQAPHTLSTIKLPILKKGEDDIWAMKMKHYLGLTDYPIWEVIQKVKWSVQVSQIQMDKKVHGISTEYANQNFLRSLLASCPALPASSSSTQNVTFVSSESTISTNDVSTAYVVSTSSGHSSQKEGSSLYSDELKRDGFEMASGHDFKRLKKFYKKTGISVFDAKEQSKGNQESRRRDAGNTGYKAKDNGRRPGKQDEPNALVTLDGDGVDWTGHAEDEQENFALMAHSNSGSNTEVTSCSKECEESYAKLKKLYDEQREQLGVASIEIQAYTQALKKVEAQLVCHQQNQLIYEEKIRFMKIDLDDKTNVLTYHKKLLAEAVKEKEELKTKLENFQSSSKGLSKLLNSQMSTRDKSGLGYGNQIHEGVLSYEKEVIESVFGSRSSDVEDSPVNDRFAKVEGIESDAKTSDFASCKTNSSVETLESMHEPVVVEPKVVSQPKVWSDAPIIEEYKSDSDDEYVIEPLKEQEKPSFAFVNTVKHAKTPRETVKEQNTCSPSPKANKRDWNGLMSKKLGLGYGFTKKACFVCGSFSHLIRDCDFHEKRMAKQVELNKKKGKGTGQGENRPVWNNVQRLNHQNKFVPKATLTKTGIFPVNATRQNPSSQAADKSTARKVNTARLIVNEIRQRNNFYKSYSPIRRPFNRTTAPKANFTNLKVNTTWDKTVSVIGGNRETVVKASAGCNWRPKRQYWYKVSKYNNGSNFSKNDNPQRALKNKGIVDSGCFRHMTENKAYLAEYQDYNGGPVAFGGSKGYITGKGKIKTGKLDFEDVCFVKELQYFNLFSVSQICDKKNKVLFTDTECLVLSSDFKLPDENQVLLRVPRQNNMYSFNLENIVPSGGLACLIAKATFDESNKWHRRETIELCGSKGIKREYSNARTLQKNGVAERKNRTLIEATRTMLADSFLPNTFWAEAVNTACYVLNRVLVTKPQNKTPWKGPNWLFDLDYLTDSMNYQPVRLENNKTAGPEDANHSAGTKDNIDAGNSKKEADPTQDYFVLPIYSSYTSKHKSSEAKNEGKKHTKDIGLKTNEEPVDQDDQDFLEELERLKRKEKEVNDAAKVLRKEFAQSTEDLLLQAGAARATSTNTVNIVSTPLSTANPSNDIYGNSNDGIFTNASYDDEGVVADFTNLESTMNISPIPTLRIHSIHPSTQILGDPKSVVQTRSKVNKSFGAHAFISYIQKQRRNNHKDFQHCLFACFLSQIKPKKIFEALEDENWLDAMQEELLQFKIQKVWILVDLPYGKKAIGTKWVYRNNQDKRGVVVRNKARLVTQGHRQEEGIDYDEVFALVARIKAIRIFLAFASYMGFIVYQMDMKCLLVVKALYGLHQAPRAWYATLSTFLLKSRYIRGTIDKTLFIKKDKNDIMLVQMSSMGELTFFLGLQVKQKEDGIFISQDKYVAEILKKFNFANVKTISTPIETQKPLTKDKEAADVDVHLYRSMIGSLMYLTASRPDIMFAVCACSRFQEIHNKRLSISWQCKKQTIMATSTIEAEYVAATSCCGQNPVFHSKTNHIEIRHHFIRDAYEKKLIQVLKIHTNENVADLLTKAFDVSSVGFNHHTTNGHRFTMSNRHQELDSPEQTASALAIPGQTATGKESSNPFMADSLPKTMQSNDPPLSRGYTLNLNQLSIHQMATLEFCDKQNMVAYLEKLEGSAEFHQIIDFLTASHIHYALIGNPTIYASFIKQFWTTTTASTNVHGEVKLTASIDGQAKTITEASLRRHLKLEDDVELLLYPIQRYLSNLLSWGMQLILISLHFKKFSINIATAIICLSTNRTFNFSKFIFDAMVKNLDNPHKFLMYPRFIQICFNKQRRLLQPHTRTYPTPVLIQKVFSNMKRATRGYSGDDIPLFPYMITAPESSPSRITSSPSLSPQHTPVSAPSTSPPPIPETTPTTEEPAPMPHNSPLQSVHSLGRNELMNTKKVYGSALTKLVNRVKKLEKQVKIGIARRGTKIVLSDNEAAEEDSSK